MKKFLTFAVFIFAVVFAQFSQAQSYTPQEGDKMIVYEHTCGYCYKQLNDTEIYRNKQLIFKEKAPRYGCNNPDTNGAHYIPTGYMDYYIYKNGSWQQVMDY